MTKISIVIVTWNCRHEIQECLNSLARITNSSHHIETIVIDNGSTDGTVETLREYEKSCTWIGLIVAYNDRNTGLSSATNQAFSMSHGDRILLCNPDIIFNSGFWEMIAFAELHDQFPIVAAEMVDGCGNTQRVVIRRFPTVARVFFDFGVIGSHVDKYLLAHKMKNDYCYGEIKFPEPVARVDHPGASFLLLTRGVILQIGGIFSNEFPVWWNDVDLAKRAARAGIIRAVLPRVRIVHSLGQSSRVIAKPLQRYMFCQSMIRYSEKWDVHPSVIQCLFVIDAILGVLINFPVWAKRIGPINAASESIRFAVAQARAVLIH